MTQVEDTSRKMRLDRESFAQGYFENAVYRHWDPYEDVPEADLEADFEKFVDDEPTEAEFDEFRTTVALFGAGEEAVTEDLMPLALALDDIDKQMFVSSQIYEEAKHTQFFDRYWRDVINPVAAELGYEVTAPTAQRYFGEDYVQLFDKNEAVMNRLLDEDTPANRAKAYCHYHLVIESVLAQTGYYGLQSSFSDSGSDEVALREFPNLDGLVGGITKIRSDEGRHVGFGMNEVRRLVHEEGVDPDIVQETLQSLMPHVAGIVQNAADVATDPVPLVEYSRDKLTRRVEILTESDATVPPVDELVKIEGADDAGAASDD